MSKKYYYSQQVELAEQLIVMIKRKMKFITL